jgi:hypothetical protein
MSIEPGFVAANVCVYAMLVYAMLVYAMLVYAMLVYAMDAGAPRHAAS